LGNARVRKKKFLEGDFARVMKGGKENLPYNWKGYH